MRIALCISIVMLLVFTMACSKKTASAPAAPATTSAEPATPPPAPAAAQAPLSELEIPVEADFEEEAEGAINAANYQQALDELEKELE